jgi:hypothetical protein
VSLLSPVLHAWKLTQYAPRTTIITSTIDATSWTIGGDYKPTPIETERTTTITSVISWTIEPPMHLARRQVQERKAEATGVWMKHPWEKGAICYECYTKKLGQYNWVKCNSSPKIGDGICGERPVGPDGEAITTTTTVTTSTTTSTTTTTTMPFTETFTTTTFLPATRELLPATTELVPPSSAVIEPRSWHRKVAFTLPWNRVRACADAEWEKRGKPNFEIRLQDVHMDDGDDCPGVVSLDFPAPVVEIETATDVKTKTITDYELAFTTTVTATLYTSISRTTLTSTPPAPPSWVPVPIPTTGSSTITEETTIVVPVPSTSTTYIPVSPPGRDAVPSHRDL